LANTASGLLKFSNLLSKAQKEITNIEQVRALTFVIRKFGLCFFIRQLIDEKLNDEEIETVEAIGYLPANLGRRPIDCF